MTNFQITGGLLVMSLLLLGAGCSLGGTPPPTPGYVNDAAEYGQTAGEKFTTSTPAYKAPRPSAEILVGNDGSTYGGKPGLLTQKPPVPAITSTPQPAPTTTTPESASMSYVKALQIYQKSGLYFQFVACHATPGSMAVKRGAKVMLDNHDEVGHTFNLEGHLYGVGAYRYVIVTPQKVGTQYVTCDGGGAATLQVQP